VSPRRLPRSVVALVVAALVLSACADDDPATDDDPGADATDAEPADPADPGADDDVTDPADEPSDEPADPTDDPDEGAPPVDDDPADPGDDTLPEGQSVATEDDVDEPLVLAVGESVSLRLSQDPGYNVGTMDPSVVVVTPVDHFDDPGYAEWLIEPVSAGTTEVVATGAGVDDLTYEVEVTG
jgi:hypothetical protein